MACRTKPLDLVLRRRARPKIQPHAVFPFIRSPPQDLFASGIHGHLGLTSANQFAVLQDAQRVGQIGKEENKIRPPLSSRADPLCRLQTVEMGFDTPRVWFPPDHAITSSAGCWGMICSWVARGTNWSARVNLPRRAFCLMANCTGFKYGNTTITDITLFACKSKPCVRPSALRKPTDRKCCQASSKASCGTNNSCP